MIVSVAAFVMGVGLGSTFLIGVAYMFGGSLSQGLGTLLGRLTWTVGSLVNGGTCIIFEHGKGYKTVPLREGAKGWEIFDNNTWEAVENPEHLQRVGLRPFGVLLRPDSEVYEDLLYSGVPGEQYDAEFYKMERRGGYPGFMPQYFWRDKDKGFIVSLVQLAQRLKLGGSTEISDKAYVEALKKYADIDALGGTGVQILFYLACLVIGCISAWLMVG